MIDYKPIPEIPSHLRSSIEYKTKLNQQGNEIWPYITAKSITTNAGKKFISLGSIPNVTFIMCSEGEGLVSYKSDEYGYRNPKGQYGTSVDILMLGDSFAEGHCVKDGYDTAGYLRKEGLTIANLGKPGSAALGELARLREYGPLLRPKHVILLYYEGNDLIENSFWNNSKLKRYLDDQYKQDIPNHQSELTKSLKSYVKIKRETFIKDIEEYKKQQIIENQLWYKVWHFLKLWRTRSKIGLNNAHLQSETSSKVDFGPKSNKIEDDLSVDRVGLEINAIKVNAHDLDTSFTVFYLPSFQRYYLNKSGSPSFKAKDKILAKFQSLNIRHYDLSPILEQNGDPMSFFGSRDRHTHYNRKGYRLLANLIKKHLPH